MVQVMPQKVYIYAQTVVLRQNYDIVRLMNALLIRYNINSSLVQISGKSRIYIASTESAKITNLVLEFIHPSMLYKVLGNYPLNKQKI